MEPVQPATLSIESAESIQTSRRTTFYRYLNSIHHIPDTEAVDIILASCRAHFFLGVKPVWIWVVGVSGSGKTEVGIRSIEGFPHIRQVGELTAKAFVSAKANQKGLLFRLDKRGDEHTGILVFKDFTSFLSMRPEDRAVVASQFREIADGYWNKDTGERGHQAWRGRVTVIAACTPALEFAWAMHRTMGDRFCNVRWRDSDSEGMAAKMRGHEGHEDEMSSTIKSMASTYFGLPTFGPAPPIPESFDPVLIKMACLSCWLRTPVHHDEYRKEIDDVGPREKPSRILKTLRAILAGHSAVQSRALTHADLKLAYRVSVDSTPLRRFKIVDSMPDNEEVSIADIIAVSQAPRSSVMRHIDDLEAIGIVQKLKRESDEGGKDRVFVRLTDEFSDYRSNLFAIMESNEGK